MNKTIEFTELELAVVKGLFYDSFNDCYDLPESVNKFMDKWKVDARATLATIPDVSDSVYFEVLESIVSKI